MMSKFRVSQAAALAVSAALLCPHWSAAQAPAITGDGTLGTSVTKVDDAYTISGGTVRGSNLFHSFGQFSVPTFGSATFEGPVAPESIQNVLSRVTGGQPSFIDGFVSVRASMPNASFFLMNPSGVVFSSGAFIDVGGALRVTTADTIRLSDGVVFSAVPAPGEAALLSSAPPQAFGFLGSSPGPISVESAFLGVDPGQTIALVGGDVQINSGVLIAPGGTIQIGSVASAGYALLSEPDLNLGSFTRLGQVGISEFSFISAGTDFFSPGGAVVIRAGRLTLDNFAVVTTSSFEAAGPAVGLDLGGRDAVELRNFAAVRSESYGSVDASGISISAGNLVVTDSAAVESLAFGTGRTGAIDIQADRADIVNGTIRTSAVASGAGDVALTATGTVTVSGPQGEISSGTFALDPGVFAGNVSVSGANVVLNDQASIRSGGLSAQAGERVTITATGVVDISGLAGISSQAFAASAGTVDISASRLRMDAGYVNTSTLGVGNAGAIEINAGVVELTGGAQIASSSQIAAPGAGGTIAITATESVAIRGIGAGDGVGAITFTNDSHSGIFSTASIAGDAGQISVSAPTVTVADGGRVSVAAEGGGNAGRIAASVRDFLLTGDARITSSTSGAGAGGAIDVNASNSVRILNGASVTADSLGGVGFTGNVTIVSGNEIVMTNGSVSTRALTSDGGNITINAPRMIRLTNSQITTSVESGTGGGGNVSIDPQFLILNTSTITANAFGGPGGNITIVANNYLPSATSVVQASSALSTPGTVLIESPENNVAGSIAQLARSFLDASALLRGLCSARRTGAPSSFVVAGRGGVPYDADGYLPSFSTDLAAPLASGAGAIRSDNRRQHGLGLLLAQANGGADCAQ